MRLMLYKLKKYMAGHVTLVLKFYFLLSMSSTKCMTICSYLELGK